MTSTKALGDATLRQAADKAATLRDAALTKYRADRTTENRRAAMKADDAADKAWSAWSETIPTRKCKVCRWLVSEGTVSHGDLFAGLCEGDPWV